MGFLKKHAPPPPSPPTMRYGLSLPPISQYTPSPQRTKPTYADEETRRNTVRNAGKPILKTSPGAAAAAAALSRLGSRTSSLKGSRADNLARLRKGNMTRSYSLTNTSLGQNRTSSLTRNSQRAQELARNGHRTASLTNPPRALNLASPRTASLTSPRTSSLTSGRTSSLTQSNLQAFGRTSSLSRSRNRTSSITSRTASLSQIDEASDILIEEDMTIQLTTTRKGNVLTRQTKVIDADGVTRRIITKTFKRVGNYEVVNSNVVNLTTEDGLGNIDEMADAEEQFAGFDEPVTPENNNEYEMTYIDENTTWNPPGMVLLKTGPKDDKVTPKTSDEASFILSSTTGTVQTALTSDDESHYSDAHSRKLESESSLMPPPKGRPTSILHKSGPLDVSDVTSARSARSGKSKVSFKGVEYIDVPPVQHKPSEKEMYNAALKVAEKMVFGEESDLVRQSSFRREKPRKERVGEGKYSMRNGEPLSPKEVTPSNTTNLDSPFKAPRRIGTNLSSPRLRKRGSISSSIRALSINSFNQKPKEPKERSLRVPEQKRPLRKEKKYLKEKEKLERMNLQEEIKNAQRKLEKKAGITDISSENFQPARIEKPVEKTEEPITEKQSKKRFKFFGLRR